MLKVGKGVRLSGGYGAIRTDDAVDKETQGSLGGNPRIELAERTCRSVAWVREGWLPVGDKTFVQGIKVRQQNHDFAAHDQVVGD